MRDGKRSSYVIGIGVNSGIDEGVGRRRSGGGGDREWEEACGGERC